MRRGPLSDPTFKGQFSGHETFPLRLLWLRKAYDAVSQYEDGAPRSLFTDPGAIIRFGVGRNMVTAIRHWALACNIIYEKNGYYLPAALGDFLFDEDGRDPFIEHAATTWLVHWMIAGHAERTTTWYWAFNHLSSESFDRETLAKPIFAFCKERKRERTTATTIKRDVECFVRSYVPRTAGKFSDDMMEPLLAELGLIRAAGPKMFAFRRGPKPELPDGIVHYALLHFWKGFAPESRTLSVETIAFEPGSPGRVFKLDEHSLVERLVRIESASAGAFLWTDTAGVRNITCHSLEIDPFTLLNTAYEPGSRRRAA